MPYVFSTSIFPPHTTNKLAKIYVDSLKDFRPKQRALAKEIIPNAVKATSKGIEVIGVMDVKEGKLDEYLLLAQQYMTNFHEIEGFRYHIEVRFKVTEALEMIGLKFPE
ncbi:MAG: hypothetical protein EAX91_18270 [Candidatus Lokiarchaeota archaeon]|nr:hypothetical protein [Candidatus Lokiarchaeota archaeon]